jgi:hypothetical protein
MDVGAGFGQPVGLPLAVLRAQAAEERAEAQEGRESARALAERVEARRSADLQMIVREAEDRGEYVDPVALATGRVTGHTLADALKSAQERWERDDRAGIRTEHRWHPRRSGCGGRPGMTDHRGQAAAGRPRRTGPGTCRGRRAGDRGACVGDRPGDLPPGRRFRAVLEARRQPGGGAGGRAVATITAWSRRHTAPAGGAGAGSPTLGFGPMNVPWSRVGQWLAQGRRRDDPDPASLTTCAAACPTITPKS